MLMQSLPIAANIPAHLCAIGTPLYGKEDIHFSLWTVVFHPVTAEKQAQRVAGH